MLQIQKIFLLLLLGVALSSSSMAKSNAKIDKVIKSSISGVTEVVAKQLILTKGQHAAVQKEAKAAVRTKIYRYYEVKKGSSVVAYGVLITRKMRTKKATVLYLFDKSGKLKFSEIMAFGEPPEFIPNAQWMALFKEQKPTASLTMGKDIPTISGSTLSARGITEGDRVARAIYKQVLKK
jgi:hypothetical protein